MPEITLEDGTKVKISVESYKELQKAVQKSENPYEYLKKYSKELLKRKTDDYLNLYTIDIYGDIDNCTEYTDFDGLDEEDSAEVYFKHTFFTKKSAQRLVEYGTLCELAYVINKQYKQFNVQHSNVQIREIRYNKNKKRFEPWIVSDFLTPGPYFNTEAATLKAIELMGEERLKLIYGIK